jgi:hypothetical protein
MQIHSELRTLFIILKLVLMKIIDETGFKTSYLKSQQPYTQLLLRATSKPAQEEIDEVHIVASG